MDSKFGDLQQAPHLTKKEQCIIKLLFEGFTNREIGAHLYLSPLTIRNYISKLLYKYGAHNRTYLLSKVIKLHRKCHKRLIP